MARWCLKRNHALNDDERWNLGCNDEWGTHHKCEGCPHNRYMGDGSPITANVNSTLCEKEQIDDAFTIYKKIADIIIIILLIANFAIAIWYCFDPSFMDKLEDDTRITIALSMVGSWSIIGGLAFSIEMSR